MVVYEPREDSFLIVDAAKELVSGDLLEVGVGSGYVSKELSKIKKVDSILGIDINTEAISYAKENNSDKKIEYVQSDLYENVNGIFDYIVCNPPYLPNEDFIDPSLFGGKKGYEYIEKMIPESIPHLKNDGKIILLFSNLTKKIEVDKIIEKNMLSKELLVEKYIGNFETLYVYLISKRKELVEIEKLGIKPEFFRKGKRGYIFTGTYKAVKVGIKIKNSVSEADSIYNEANMLKKVNMLGIGPNLLFSSEDMVIYEFFEGEQIGEFVLLKSKEEIVSVLIKVFDELRILDVNKIDKKEMSHPHKHILVGKKGQICFIDFERSRLTDSPSNVTGFCQFVTSSNFGELLKEKGIIIDKEKIIGLSKEYKNDYSKISYKKIIALITSSS